MKDPIKEPILVDPIVEELHRIRAERSARFNHDLHAMVKDLQRREAISRARGVKFVAPPKRRKPRGARKTTSAK